MQDKTEKELNMIIFHLLGSKGPYYCADYTTNWKKTGPIIEREGISLFKIADSPKWSAYKNQLEFIQYGDTPLIAAMRCYVASKNKQKLDNLNKII